MLVEGIKEQQIQITKLQEQINAYTNTADGLKLGQAGNTLTESTGLKALLYQNAPNPFNTETYIKYFIPKTVKTANIYIYDVEGKKTKSVLIENRGEGQLKIAANELGQGIYFYSLIIDSTISDSKTMLITQ